MRSSYLLSTAVCTFATLGMAGLVPAATITWSPVATVTGSNSDVDTTGLFFASAASTNNGSGGDLVVNGVDFDQPAGRVVSTNSFVNNSLVASHITIQSDDPTSAGFGGVTPSFGPSDYATMLSWAQYNHNYGNDLITITGLTSGTNYEVQMWTPYWSAANPTVYIAGNTSGTLVNGTSSSFPRYVIGTFTADGTGTQSITYGYGTGSPNLYGFLSAIQVRNESVPEPASFVLMIPAALILVRWLRRTR